MTTITQEYVATVLRLDHETNELHWLKAARGKKAGNTRAGWDAKTRDGVRRVLKIKGKHYDHDAIKALLLTGELPEQRARRKRTAKRIAPKVEVPAAMPEVARAVVAAAKPEHRGWLAGLGLRRAA